MKRRPITSRFYIKLVLFCFLITSVPVILLGIFSYLKSSDVVQHHVNKEKTWSLTQAHMNVEQTLKIADQTTVHFLNSKSILGALNETLTPEQYPLFNLVKVELNSLQRLDTGIADITLLSRKGNWLINNNGLYRLEDWMKTNSSLDRFLDPNMSSMWVTTENPAGSSCRHDVQLVKKLPLTSYTATGLAVIKIPACNLSRLFTIDEAQETLLLFDDKGQLIIQKGQLPEGEAVISKLYADTSNASRSAGQAQYQMESEHKGYTVTYRKSEYNGWIYVSLVTLDQLKEQSRGIGWYTLYICVGLLLLFIVLSWFWSRKVYSPIAKIYRDMAGEQNEELPDHAIDEIQFIGEQVHSLMRTQKQLEGKLKGHLAQLETFLMVKLFLGGMKEDEIVEQMESFGIRTDFQQYAVLALQIDALELTRFEEKDRDLLMFAINNIVGELLEPAKRLSPILLGRSQITVITADSDKPDAFQAELLEKATFIQRKMEEVLNVTTSIGISIAHQKLSEIPRAYEEASEALKQRARYGDGSIISYGDLGEDQALNYSYPLSLQSELLDAIKLLDRAQVERLLNQMLEVIASPSMSPYDQQFNAARLLMNLLNVASGYVNQPMHMSKQQTLFDELFKLDILQEGAGWFLDKLIVPLMEGIEEHTETRHLQIAKELVRIIHEEFDTDLTIESCADRLHYNASYLGTIFRKSMDISFSMYLAQHRHQVALKWLKETDMSIKDISERLRYNNAQNMIRSFRKVEGVTPGKYRELYRMEQGSERPTEGEA
jgi:AraC-like DNA-binding protein